MDDLQTKDDKSILVGKNPSPYNGFVLGLGFKEKVNPCHATVRYAVHFKQSCSQIACSFLPVDGVTW